MHPLGFLRVTAASTPTAVANPTKNRESIEAAMAAFPDSDIVVFGELCLSGYTCGELFTQVQLLDACRAELVSLARKVPAKKLIVVGLPLAVSHSGRKPRARPTIKMVRCG